MQALVVIVLLPFAALSAAVGRLAYHAAAAHRDGRVSRQAMHWLMGAACSTAMLTAWGVASFFVLPRHLTEAEHGLFVTYMGCALSISWYPGCRYRRYLKGTDIGELPPLDARHRSLSLWLTRGACWIWPLPLGLAVGGLYAVFAP